MLMLSSVHAPVGISALSLHAGSAVPKHSMLHECYKFKDPSSFRVPPLIEALHLIVGKLAHCTERFKLA